MSDPRIHMTHRRRAALALRPSIGWPVLAAAIVLVILCIGS